jgi:hypothetical protein
MELTLHGCQHDFGSALYPLAVGSPCFSSLSFARLLEWIYSPAPLAHPLDDWSELALDVLRPIPSFPKHPWLMARFGIRVVLPARMIAKRFRGERTRALFAGLAAHSFLSLDEPLSAAAGLFLSNATGRRRAWSVRLSCSENGVVDRQFSPQDRIGVYHRLKY